jgi:hypothetical protein
MTPEAQRIAIAKACPSLGWWMDHEGWWHFKDGSRMMGGSVLSDLNAMAHVLATLDSETEDVQTLYMDNLMLVGPWPNTDGKRAWYMLRTTAARQAEAYLRTKGLWKEDA